MGKEEGEDEFKTEEDLTGQPQFGIRKALDRKRENGKTYYLVDWDATWEPREGLPQTVIARFTRERRLLVRRTYIEFEAEEAYERITVAQWSQ